MRIFLSVLLLLSLPALAQDSKFQKFKSLHCSEKMWVITHPFVAGKALSITENAWRVAKELINVAPMDGYENGGKADAFRHTFWMASLSQEIRWRKAYKLGKAHEKGNKRDFIRNKTEEGILPDAISCEMDLWNNKAGLTIGRACRDTVRRDAINGVSTHRVCTQEELIYLVKQAIINGKCKIIKMDVKGNYLDELGKIIPDEEWRGKWENKRCLINSN